MDLKERKKWEMEEIRKQEVPTKHQQIFQKKKKKGSETGETPCIICKGEEVKYIQFVLANLKEFGHFLDRNVHMTVLLSSMLVTGLNFVAIGGIL